MNNRIIRLSNERGYFDHGWLKSYHSFSFAQYFDPKFMNFHSLRVINEDFIKSKTGFDLHPHESMEIITFVMKGVLTHIDNIGNREEIYPQCFQIMSAGDGIIHGEFNYGDEEVHLLQIWIKPNEKGGKPSYKIFKPDINKKWALIASFQDDHNSKITKNFLSIKQNASVYAIDSSDLTEIYLPNLVQKNLWLQVASGSIEMSDGLKLKAGDAIGINNNNQQIELRKIFFQNRSELILFGL